MLSIRWRFGAVGLFSGALTGVVFALAWLMGVALLLSHRRTARGFAVVNLVLSVVLVLVAGSFVLDFLQSLSRPPQIVARVVLPPQVMYSFVASLRDNLNTFSQRFGAPAPPRGLRRAHPDDGS